MRPASTAKRLTPVVECRQISRSARGFTLGSGASNGVFFGNSVCCCQREAAGLVGPVLVHLAIEDFRAFDVRFQNAV